MELCIKTSLCQTHQLLCLCFNPCFNGTMYKNDSGESQRIEDTQVSILVLMELCIKTISFFTRFY